MRRLTISVDDDLADTFDRLVKEKGYDNRSEAFRDLCEARSETREFAKGTAKYCLGPLS